jgi:uncharacterized protein DUF4279
MPAEVALSNFQSRERAEKLENSIVEIACIACRCPPPGQLESGPLGGAAIRGGVWLELEKAACRSDGVDGTGNERIRNSVWGIAGGFTCGIERLCQNGKWVRSGSKERDRDDFRKNSMRRRSNMTKANKCYAYFKVEGSFDPAQITGRVGINPTKSLVEGSAIERTQMARKCSRWELHSRLESTATLEGHVVDVLTQLDENRNAFKQLSAELGGVIKLVGYYTLTTPA